MMNTRDRLIEFLRFLKISQGEFEEIVGFYQGFVSKIDDTIKADNLRKISDVYADLNVVWLLTGEGEMLKPSSTRSITGHNNDNNVSISVDIINVSETERLQTRISELEEKVAELTEKLVQEKEHTIQILLSQSRQ